MKRHESKNPGLRKGRVFRPVLLGLIVMAVCFGFWTNNQRRLEVMVSQGLLKDETGVLTSAQKDDILRYIKPFKQEFGVVMEVNILNRPPALKNHDASRIYLDIAPDQGRAYLHMPPLVRNAVGQEFIRDMETAFRQDFANGDWRSNLISALIALKSKLHEVTR